MKSSYTEVGSVKWKLWKVKQGNRGLWLSTHCVWKKFWQTRLKVRDELRRRR